MLLKGLFAGTLRIVTIIVLSVVALVLLGFIAYGIHSAYAHHEAAPYEEMKPWALGIQHPLEMFLAAKTKVVDGRLYADYELKGWPAYMTDPMRSEKNKQAFVSFQFFDKDGFVLYEKKVNVLEFSRRVGDDGKPLGLDFQSVEPLTADTYSQFTRVGLLWTLDTSASAPSTPLASVEPPKLIPDPCASGLSRAERMRRLAQYGPVRDEGLGSFSAGGHTVKHIGGDLFSCH
jgi:hypothetical protein